VTGGRETVEVKKVFRGIVGFSISGILLVMAFYKTPFSEVVAAIKEVNPAAVSSSVAMFGLSCFFRALMWRVTTKPLGRVKFSTLFGGVVVGYMANNVLPMRAGEMVRAYYLTARTETPLAASLATIFIERAYDVFSLGLLLAVALIWGVQGIAPDKARAALFFLAIISAGIIVLADVLARYHAHLGKIFFFEPIMERLKEFVRPLNRLRDFKTAFVLGALSLIAWFSNYLSMLVLVRGIAVSPLEASLLLLLFVNLGLLVPSSPGAFGVMQAAFWLALAPFGVPKEQGLALSFAYQGGLYLFTLAVGLPYFLRAQLRAGSWREAPVGNSKALHR